MELPLIQKYNDMKLSWHYRASHLSLVGNEPQNATGGTQWNGWSYGVSSTAIVSEIR